MSENQIVNFLRAVNLKTHSLKEAKSLYEKQIAPDFYIFDYLRDDELGLSRCIANLINPYGKHGQGDVFLKSFMKVTNNVLMEQLSSFENSDVSEQTTTNYSWLEINTTGCKTNIEIGIDNQRRIDILLTFAHGEMLAIENKPWAGDQKNQLLDYAEYLKKRAFGKAWLLIYLCNNDPSEHSISRHELLRLQKQGNLITLNYTDLVTWLSSSVSDVKSHVVRTFIEELAKYIRKDINGELDMSTSNEVKKIIMQDGNFEAALNVSKAIEHAKKELISKFKYDLSNLIQAQEFQLRWKDVMDNKWSSYSGFGINFGKDEPHDFELWFEFRQPNLKGFYWGIRRKDVSITENKDHWSLINQVMSSRFGRGQQSSWWPWSVDYELDENYKNWDISAEPWNAINRGTFAEKILSIANSVYDHFKESSNDELLVKNGIKRDF